MEEGSEKVYWTLLEDGAWHLYIAATDQGLCYIGSPHAPFEEMETWINKQIPKAEIIENDDVMQAYAEELIEFLNNKRRDFAMPLDFRGTEFQRKVWDELMKVPYGELATYTDIAHRIGRPDAARAVGTAIGRNPMLIIVPCHRMVGKSGEWRGYRGGLAMKKQLMEIEGLDTSGYEG